MKPKTTVTTDQRLTQKETTRRAMAAVCDGLSPDAYLLSEKAESTFTVHLARSGERQQVAAQDWRSALKATGRPDACWIVPQADGAIDATFDPDHPTTITTRCRQGTEAERLTFALACVANELDKAAGAARA